MIFLLKGDKYLFTKSTAGLMFIIVQHMLCETKKIVGINAEVSEYTFILIECMIVQKPHIGRVVRYRAVFRYHCLVGQVGI